MESLTASGRSLTDCHALTSRYDETTDVEGAYEALVVHGAADGKFYAVQSSPGYRDLWRSPSGRLYVAAFHEMHWSDTPTQGGGGWERHRTGGIVRRVGGLDDTLVFAHGGGHDSPMFRFDGSDWVPLASPGVVLAIHGTSPDLRDWMGAPADR